MPPLWRDYALRSIDTPICVPLRSVVVVIFIGMAMTILVTMAMAMAMARVNDDIVEAKAKTTNEDGETRYDSWI